MKGLEVVCFFCLDCLHKVKPSFASKYLLIKSISVLGVIETFQNSTYFFLFFFFMISFLFELGSIDFLWSNYI